MGRKKKIKQSGFSEPFDQSIVSVPDGWYGGRVENSGGNIYMRLWYSEPIEDIQDKKVEEYYEAGYREEFNGASIITYVKDNTGLYYHDELIDEIPVKDGTDKKCADAAVRLMKQHSD